MKIRKTTLKNTSKHRVVQYVRGALSSIDFRVRRFWLRTVQWWKKGQHQYGRRWELGTQIAAVVVIGVIVGGLIAPIANYVYGQSRYRLSDATHRLVGAVVPKLANQITYDSSKDEYQFNKDAVTAAPTSASIAHQHSTVGTPGSKKTATFSVDLPTIMGQGITYHETNAQLSFSLIPQFGASDGRKIGGQLIYPLSDGGQAIYTLKGNGLKEDLVFDSPVTDTMTFNYDLSLPKSLVARLDQTTGDVGIYSVDPALLGDVATSSPSDAGALEKARDNGDKNHLLFDLPAPIIKDAHGVTSRAKAHFDLVGDVLTLSATGLKGLVGPVSIDPTVTVTSSTDFQLSGNNDSDIDYTTAGQITRGALTGGSLGAWTTNTDTGATLPANNFGATVAYNGYLFMVIGTSNVVYSAPINSDGTLGAWVQVSSYTTTRYYMGTVAYNGYLYVFGGNTAAPALLSDVQYAKINSNGSLGPFATSVNSMATPVCRFGYTAYNGYLYATGGDTVLSSTCGNGSTPSNIVQYAPIMANGDVGAWTVSGSSFTGSRMSPGTVAYNGYLYVSQGTLSGSGNYTDTQYAPILASGNIGTWLTSSTTISTGHYRFAMTVANGYMYIMGGGGGASTTDVWYAQINANGNIGQWVSLATLNTGRWGNQSTAYNGYLYTSGGTSSGGSVSTTEFAKIDVAGSVVQLGNVANAFTTARSLSCGTAYNGFLYEIGGSSDDSGNNNLATTAYSALNSTGGNGAWTTSTPLPEARGSVGCVAYNGYIYVLGGYTGSTVSSALVRYAPLNASTGAIGTWVTTAPSLPAALQRPGVFVHATSSGTYLYSLGGGNATNTIYYASLNLATGAVGSWVTNTNYMAQGIPYRGFAQVGKYLYALAGGNGSSNATTEYATINEDGSVSSWTNTTSENTALAFGNATSVNGCIYSVGGETAGGTSISNVQYVCPNSDGTLPAWQNGQSLPTATTDSSVTSYNGYVYVIGGYTTATVTSTAYMIVGNGGGGSSGAWTTNGGDLSTQYSSGVAYAKSFAANGYIYFLGGFDGTNVNANVYSAPLGNDGSVGTFSATSSMLSSRYAFGLVVYGNYVYAVGGITTGLGYTATVESAQILSGGLLGSWVSQPSITTARQLLGLTVWNGYIYMAGGSNGSAQGDIQYASVSNGTVGSWITYASGNASSFTNARFGPGLVAANGYLYIMGGYNTIYYNDVQYAPLNSDGSITASSWKYTTSLILYQRYIQVSVYNGFMYIISSGNSNVTGSGGGVSVFKTQQAIIRADGTIGSWFYSLGAMANSHYQAATTIYNGFMYRLAGFDGTSYYKDIQYSPLNTIARTGRYSKLVDLGGAENISGITFNNISGIQGSNNYTVLFKTSGGDGVLSAAAAPQSITTSGCINTSGQNSARFLEAYFTLDDSLTGAVYPDASGASGSVTNVTDFTTSYIQGHPNANIRLRTGETLVDGGLSPLDICQP